MATECAPATSLPWGRHAPAIFRRFPAVDSRDRTPWGCFSGPSSERQHRGAVWAVNRGNRRKEPGAQNPDIQFSGRNSVGAPQIRQTCKFNGGHSRGHVSCARQKISPRFARMVHPAPSLGAPDRSAAFRKCALAQRQVDKGMKGHRVRGPDSTPALSDNFL